MHLLQTGWLLVLILMPCQGQTAPLDDDENDGLTTIVIAPKWRKADLQKTPSTTNTLSGQQLDAAAVRNTRDLQNTVPGLVFSSSAGIGEPHLRGVGGSVSATGDPGVAMFVDGVYQKRSVQSLRDFYDTERVEVLKGPHGIDLGHNVVAGAISIITRDPEPYWDAYADLLYGSSQQREVQGAVNLPLSDAGWSLRLAGSGIKRDGYSRNLFRHEDLDDRDYHSWRGKLRYRPSADIDIVFSAEQSAQDDTQGLSRQPNPDIGVNGGLLMGGSVPDDPRKVMRNVDEGQAIKGRIYSAKVVWDVGDVELLSITAYQQTDMHTTIDLDATEVDFSSNTTAMNVDAVSQELRIGSRQGQAFGWDAGLFFMHEDATQQLDVRLPTLGIQNVPVSKTVDSSYAAFAELSYALTPQWRARAGLRYSHDEIKLDLQQTVIDAYGLQGPAGSSTFLYREKNDWETVTPEFSLAFSPDQEKLYYAKVSRGYKAGGYNAYSIQPAYAPEYLWAYETGVKATLPGKQMRVNAALFYYDYTDIQIITLPAGAPQGTLPIVANAARASIQGLDLRAWYRPVWALELNLGATLLDAHFDDFESVDPNNPADNPDRSGDPLTQAPAVSLVLGGEYRWGLADAGDVRLSLNYKYQSKVYFNPYHDPAVRQDDYALLNASLGYASRQGSWHAELYGRNLTDALYAQNIIRIDPAVGTGRIWAEPRTFGLRLGYRF